MLANIVDNFKKNFKYDVLSVVLLLLWIITSFLYINLDKINFWSSLFYLFSIMFFAVYLFVAGIRLFSYKLSNILINAFFIYVLYNLIRRTTFHWDDYFAFIEGSTFGINNSIYVNVGLLILLLATIWKKITTKHLSALFGLMFFTNTIVNIPSIYNNILTPEQSVKNIDFDELKPLYKNPEKPNIYVLMTDTYPSFYNLRNYMGFSNDKFKNYLNDNDFKVYDQIYAGRYGTYPSMSVFFGNKNLPYKQYFGTSEYDVKKFEGYFVEDNGDGFFMNQVHLKTIKKYGYEVNATLYPKKWDISHHYLTGFFDYIKVNLRYYIIQTFSYFDNSYKNEKYILNNWSKKFLSEESENSINIVFSSNIKSRLPCLSEKRLKYTELSIHNIKCANKDITGAVNVIKKHDPNSFIIVMSDHGYFFQPENPYGRIIWLDEDNIVQKKLGVLLAIHYPKQCANYKNIKFTSLESVMPLALACINGYNTVKAKKTLPKNEYSYIDYFDINRTPDRTKKYIINGVIQE